MSAEFLAERRKWFRVFPEGTLEFTIITRVLALLMLMALAIVGGAQRPFVVAALVGVLWLDYALLMWWVVQVAGDLRAITAAGPGSVDLTPQYTKVGTVVLLPSVAAAVAMVPWGTMLGLFGLDASLARLVSAIAAVLFVVMFVPAHRALLRIHAGSSCWTGLVLVPFIHWFALHRVAAALSGRIQQQQVQRNAASQSPRTPSVAILLADITWVLTLLPWAVAIGVALTRGWPSNSMFKAVPVCGTVLAAAFAVANLAAMEGVQRQMVALIRKA
jgi:hypothetical protein